MKNHWLEQKEEIRKLQERDKIRLEVREELRASMEKEYTMKLREIADYYQANLHEGFNEAFEMVNAQRERAEKAEEELRILRLRLLVCTCCKEKDASNR